MNWFVGIGIRAEGIIKKIQLQRVANRSDDLAATEQLLEFRLLVIAI